MASSDVAVASQALALLGLSAIQSMDEDTTKAQVVSQLYEDLVQNLIAIHPWRFAMTKAQLSRETAAPLGEWTYSFLLPSDRVGDGYALFETTAVNARPINEFEVFEGKVLTNFEELWIDYMQRKAEVNWPPYFTVLMRLALAAELAEPLTDDTSKAQYYRALAFGTPAEQGMGGQFRIARNRDAFQNPPVVVEDFQLIDVRFS